MLTKCIWKRLKEAVTLFSSYLPTILLYPSLNPTAFSNRPILQNLLIHCAILNVGHHFLLSQWKCCPLGAEIYFTGNRGGKKMQTKDL